MDNNHKIALGIIGTVIAFLIVISITGGPTGQSIFSAEIGGDTAVVGEGVDVKPYETKETHYEGDLCSNPDTGGADDIWLWCDIDGILTCVGVEQCRAAGEGELEISAGGVTATDTKVSFWNRIFPSTRETPVYDTEDDTPSQDTSTTQQELQISGDLKGTGPAYACINAGGELYRSATACV